MRKIAIIGSGQAGLVCAHGLRRAGHAVTLYSDRTPEAWLSQSRPTGVAARFGTALAYERELGLNHWDATPAKFEGVHLTLCPAIHNRLLTMTGRFARTGAGVDLRLQSHRWMLDLEGRGGKIEIGEVTLPRLEEIAREHDLTIVATGKGGLASLFPRDEQRSVYTKAQRHASMVCFKGPPLHQEGLPFLAVKFKIVGPAGECFWLPFHHKDVGPSWVIGFDARWGGPMDRFQNAKSAKDVLDSTKAVMRDLMPWESRWFDDAEPSDELGWQVGAVTPAVRHPVGRLPSGQVVTALGDTAVAYDPIAAQGANSGNRLARTLVESITARGEGPLDEAWMRATFERHWSEHARYATALTNLLLEPPTPMAVAYLVAQYGTDGAAPEGDGAQALADAFVENMSEPSTLTPILQDQAKIRAFIREKMGGLLGPVAKSVPRLLRAQIRQRLGKDPGHPLLVRP
jgi:2-polyprenyl-6-methoxyphenol hydroxylase-like FAD-dependent oxidoreductase